MQKRHTAFETNVPHNFTWKLSRTIISTNHRFPPGDNLEFNPKVCPPLFHLMSVPKHLATDLLITDDYIAGHFCITRDLDIFFLLYTPTTPVPHYQLNLPQIKKKTEKEKKKLAKIDPSPPPLPSRSLEFYDRGQTGH